MGNQQVGHTSGHHHGQSQTSEPVNTTDSTNYQTMSQPAETISSAQTVQFNPTPQIIPQPVPKRPAYVHPFIELINRPAPETEIINTLSAFMCCTQIGTDSNGRPIYEEIDQTIFMGPITQVFSYGANNGRMQLTKWILDNYIPLQVSYDNNFCYFESLRWSHFQIADMIAQHESFVPTINVLENFISRNKYDLFKHCMKSPYLRGDLQTYRFTFVKYISDANYVSVQNLLSVIKKKEKDESVIISDTICPNPLLIKSVPVGPIMGWDELLAKSPVAEPAVTPTVEPTVAPTVEPTVAPTVITPDVSLTIEPVESSTVQLSDPTSNQTTTMDVVSDEQVVSMDVATTPH